MTDGNRAYATPAGGVRNAAYGPESGRGSVACRTSDGERSDRLRRNG